MDGRAPLTIPLLALAAGIVLAEMTGAGVIAGTIGCAVAALCALIILSLRRKPSLAMRLNPLHYLWVVLLFLSLGIIDFDSRRPVTLPEDRILTFSAEVCQVTQLTSGLRAIVELRDVSEDTGRKHDATNIKAILYFDSPATVTGDIISFRAIPVPVSDSPDRLPSGYADQMRRRGILYTLRPENRCVTVSGHENGILPLSAAIRDRLTVLIEHMQLDRETKNFIITVLLGDRTYLDPSLLQLFADAGVAHIIALSGMHVGIISAILLFILFPLNLTGRYKWRFLMTAILLWVYVFITGLPVTAVRAAVMTSFIFVAVMLERRNSAFNALCGSLLLILLVTPWALFEVGLQLSAACVTSLILFGNRFIPVDRHDHPRLYILSTAIVTSLVTTLSTWVITAFYFDRFPVAFLPANLMALPILPWWISAVLLYISLSALGIRFVLLGRAIDLAYSLFSDFALWLSDGGAVAIPVHVGWLTLLLWLAGIVLFRMALIHRRRSICMTSAILCCAGSIVAIPLFPKEMPEGFIVSDSCSEIRVTAYSGGNETRLIFPAGKCSTAVVAGRRVVAVDSRQLPEGINREVYGGSIVIVGPGYRDDLDTLYLQLAPERILIHRSVYQRRERHLIDNSSLPSQILYSLRDSGPLHLFNSYP